MTPSLKQRGSVWKEAASPIDTRTKAIVPDARADGRRLSTVKNSDAIMVLELYRGACELEEAKENGFSWEAVFVLIFQERDGGDPRRDGPLQRIAQPRSGI